MSGSGIPTSSVLVACCVLVAVAGIVVVAYVKRPRPHRGPVQPPELPPIRSEQSLENGATPFLVSLGEAMIDAGQPVTQAQDSLQRVAEAIGVVGGEIVVLATALIVSVPAAGGIQTAVAAAGGRPLRLDQIDAVFEVVREAERGAVSPADGSARLSRIRATGPPYGLGVRVPGYAALSVGLALILRGSWADVLLAGVLGAAVGAAQIAFSGWVAQLRVFLPVLSAFGVSLVVFGMARTGLHIDVYAPLIAPLVTFLPGALLTTAVIELATGQMVSGAARLATGALQLVLLALGILAAAELAGVPAPHVLGKDAPMVPDWASWFGVALFGWGVVVYHCARRASTGWILVVLYAAYAGQVLGGLFFGGLLSAFIGALVMTPIAMLAAARRGGPPTIVSFLPAFWLLVPGALGLVGVTQYLGAERTDGMASLVTTGATMVGIALGVLLGLSVGQQVEDLNRKVVSKASS